VETGEPIWRSSEIEEVTNLYVIHPIANRLTLMFARLGVTPNMVSVAGMMIGVLAGFAYYRYQDMRWALAGFVLMVAWHVMDGADGQLARLTNAQSEAGKILDGICDYVTFIAVYSALAMVLSRQMGKWAWVLAIVAGFCHIFQSAAYEFQRQEFNFWGWDQKSAEFVMPDLIPRVGAGGVMAFGLPDLLYRTYVRLQFLVVGGIAPFRKRLGVMLEQEPARAELVRQRYREMFGPSVRRWSVMSANYRTFGIFVFALLNAPEYYFAIEIVVLNVLLAELISRQPARYVRFFNSLGAS
jgi:phosphatidylglycerophosphate synthase